jgi:hypothetical protein
MPWPLYIPGKDPVPIVQKAGWAPGPVWKEAENLAPTRIQSPDSPTIPTELPSPQIKTFLVYILAFRLLMFHPSTPPLFDVLLQNE